MSFFYGTKASLYCSLNGLYLIANDKNKMHFIEGIWKMADNGKAYGEISFIKGMQNVLPYVNQFISKEIEIAVKESVGTMEHNRYHYTYWLKIDDERVSDAELAIIKENPNDDLSQKQKESVKDFCKTIGTFIFSMVYAQNIINSQSATPVKTLTDELMEYAGNLAAEYGVEAELKYRLTVTGDREFYISSRWYPYADDTNTYIQSENGVGNSRNDDVEKIKKNIEIIILRKSMTIEELVYLMEFQHWIMKYGEKLGYEYIPLDIPDDCFDQTTFCCVFKTDDAEHPWLFVHQEDYPEERPNLYFKENRYKTLGGLIKTEAAKIEQRLEAENIEHQKFEEFINIELFMLF